MKHFRLTAAILALLTLAACSKDDDSEQDKRTAIKVTNAGIKASTDGTLTRAMDNAWEANDAIGIVLMDPATSLLAEGKTVYNYVTSTTSGSFDPADADNTAYYPDAADKTVSILAFYPYQEIGTDLMIPVSTASQGSLSSIDLMAADASTGHSKTNPEVSLDFRHKLVKLSIILDSKMLGEAIDPTAGATLTLQGTATTAQWDLKEGKLTGMGNIADIDIPTVWNSAEKLFEATAIVMPTGPEATVKLIIKINGKTFEAVLKPGTALLPGTINSLIVELSLTEAVINATVTDWTTGVTADLKTLPITVTASSGNEAGISNLTLWTEAAPTAKTTYTWNEAAQKWNSPAPFYLDNLTATDAFYARYTPMQADGTTPETDPVSGLGDVLGNTSAASVNGGGISVMLEHLMAKLNLVLTASEDFPAGLSMAGATLTLNGFLKQAELDDRNVVTALGGGDGSTTSAYTLTADEAGNATLLVAPQTIAAGTQFTVQVVGAAAAYTATLKEDLTLAAGTISNVNLTVSPMETAIDVAVKEWETGEEAEQAITIDGIDDLQGGVTSSYKAAQGDVLSITCETKAANYSYDATAEAWSSSVPFYWDDFEKADSYTFTALITPAAAGTPEKDFLAGTTTAAFGKPISFSGADGALKHLMAQLTVVLKPGTGYTAEALKQAKVVLVKGYSVLAGSFTDSGFDLFAPAENDLELSINTADDASIALNTLTLCPQQWEKGTLILKVQMPDNGPVYEIKASTGKDFLLTAGTRNKITATISKTEMNIAFSVTDWVDGENDLDADGELVDPAQ